MEDPVAHPQARRKYPLKTALALAIVKSRRESTQRERKWQQLAEQKQAEVNCLQQQIKELRQLLDSRPLPLFTPALDSRDSRTGSGPESEATLQQDRSSSRRPLAQEHPEAIIQGVSLLHYRFTLLLLASVSRQCC